MKKARAETRTEYLVNLGGELRVVRAGSGLSNPTYCPVCGRSHPGVLCAHEVGEPLGAALGDEVGERIRR